MFIHSSVDGRLDCFRFGTIMNNATMYQFSHGHTFSLLLGVYLEWNCWVVETFCLTFWGTARLLYRGYTTLHSQQCMSVPISPYPSQYLSLSFYWGPPSTVKCSFFFNVFYNFIFTIDIWTNIRNKFSKLRPQYLRSKTFTCKLLLVVTKWVVIWLNAPANCKSIFSPSSLVVCRCYRPLLSGMVFKATLKPGQGAISERVWRQLIS